MTDDTKRGIVRKYEVKRTDGSSGPGGKHERCAYFVLDLEHDEFAIDALKAYAKACRTEYPLLADDIDQIVENERSRCSCREAMCPHVMVFSPDGHSEMADHLMHAAERKQR